MAIYNNWLKGPTIEQAQKEFYKTITLLKRELSLTTQTLLASCIIPGQVIKKVAEKHPEEIIVQEKKTATSNSLVTTADHLSQTLADCITCNHFKKQKILDNVYFHSEESKTKEYQQFFTRKEYQAYFTLTGEAEKTLKDIYQKKTIPKQYQYLSNLDALDGTSCFKKWLQTNKTEDARWTIAHTFSEVRPSGRIQPLATVIHNPVINRTYLLEKESNTFIAIDSKNRKIVNLKENQTSVCRLIISSKPKEKKLQSIDQIIINELTRNQEVKHQYSEAGSIFDCCEVVDPESPITSTYSLAVGGLHDVHIPLWKISTSANLRCPEWSPMEIEMNDISHADEYAFVFGPERDIKLFYNNPVIKEQLKLWYTA